MNEKPQPNDNLPARDNSPPDQAKLERLVRESLRDVLNAQQQKQVFERLFPRLQTFVISVSKFHSGPLPSTETARGYEDILPGSFERVLQMAERDQAAVIDSTKFQAKSDSRYRMCSLICGALALGAILGLILYLAVNGHKEVAIAVAGLGAVGIIGTFVNARWGEKSDA
jgi:uncharacterized membrane protein